MKNLTLHKISSCDHLLFPNELFNVGLHSPATRLMIDFRKERPHIIDANIPIREGKNVLQKTHSELLVVADEKLEFAGLMSPAQFNEEAIIKRISNGEERNLMTVSDFMIKREAIRAFEYQAIKNTSIDNIIHTLQTYGERYCMVVDSADHSIVGMFSVNELSQRLHIPIDINQQPSFAELVTAIAQH